MRPFSIPKADRWAAATARRLVLPGARAAFSIPKADRWAAARNPAPGAPAPGRPLSVSPKRIDGLQLGRAALLAQLAQPLSVSPKRIDGLQHIDEIRAYVEQYAPFSIPKADRWAAASGAGPRPSLRASSFSIPKRIDGLQPSRAYQRDTARPKLSVSPKRIDGLQPRAVLTSSVLRARFQYPQSGSMGCSSSRP